MRLRCHTKHIQAQRQYGKLRLLPHLHREFPYHDLAHLIVFRRTPRFRLHQTGISHIAPTFAHNVCLGPRKKRIDHLDTADAGRGLTMSLRGHSQPPRLHSKFDAPHGSNPGDSRFADRSLHYARSYMISTSVWVRAHPALPYM